MQKKSLVLIALFFLMSCSQSQESATFWVNKVAEIEGRSRTTFNKIAEKLDRQEYEIAEMLESAAKENNAGREELKAMEPIEYGDGYRTAALEMMDIYDEFFQRKAPSLVHVLKDSVSEAEVTNVMNDYEASLMRRDEIDNRLINAQKMLIAKYGLKTEDSANYKVQSMR